MLSNQTLRWQRTSIGEDGKSKSVDSETKAILSGLRILVIDDSEINQIIMSRMLSSLGCQMVVADSGTQAIRIITDKRHQLVEEDGAKNWSGFDLILCDLHMPGLDG